MSFVPLIATLLCPLLSGCDAGSTVPQARTPNRSASIDTSELATPVIESRLMSRTYGMGGLPMRRGLVVFGERVLVVARPVDDHTPQHILSVNGAGAAHYLRRDGAFALMPKDGGLREPAVLQGEGYLADYADGVVVLFNFDSLSEWTDSGFLDWGTGTVPSGAPSEWSTQVPLIVRESHQLTVAALGPDAGNGETLMVGHVSRLYKGADKSDPVRFPSAMISLDRGRTWTWSPEKPELPPTGSAYAAAWPDAPGGGAILYFVHTLPGDDATPPLAVFRRDASSSTGVSLAVPYRSRTQLWTGYESVVHGRSFVPTPIRHWVTRWGLFLDTTSEGLFWMDHPNALPRRMRGPSQTMDAPERTLYFSFLNELMRVLPWGGIERLEDPEHDAWTLVGEIHRPEGTRWIQAAASDRGTLWLLGLTDTPDVSIATWPAGRAF